MHRLLAIALLLVCGCAKKAESVWAEEALGGGGDLHINELFALGPADVWGVSRPNVFHYDGQRWSLVGAPGAEHLAAIAADDVWGVGRGGSWFHFDGKSWTDGRVHSVAAGFRDFYGVVAWKNDVWATAAIEGAYSRWDGLEWSEVRVPELAGLRLERISNIDRHVYVALATKGRAALGHFDGEKWSVIDEPPGMRVRGSAPDDVWIVLSGGPRHFDGTRWSTTALPAGAVPYDLFSRSKSEAYLVGKNGLAMKWDGTSWTELPTGTRSDLFAVSGGAEGPVWAAGVRGKMLRYPR